jgi:8-oxo-dGTP pyrophosphatase MutT (NUDIX family)
MADEKLFHVGIKGLIENKDSKILLLHSPGWAQKDIPPHWDIPGGRVSDNEDALLTLQREIEEETGLTKLENTEFFYAVISNHEITLTETKKLGLVLMIYTVTILPGSKMTLSEEHDKYEWVDKHEAAERLANKYPTEFTNLLKA